MKGILTGVAQNRGHRRRKSYNEDDDVSKQQRIDAESLQVTAGTDGFALCKSSLFGFAVHIDQLSLINYQTSINSSDRICVQHAWWKSVEAKSALSRS
jgi:hypothetical protein